MKHISDFNAFKNISLSEKRSYYINDMSDNLDEIVYGNAPIEFKEIIENENDPIKQWFQKEGLIKKIIEEAPLNSSETTKEDLSILIEKTAKATGDDLTFARYADDQRNLPNLFIDLLQSKGYNETMEEYFMVDNQTDVILNFLKNVINRPRPYQLAKELNLPIFPIIRTDANSAAYPSGHTLDFLVTLYHFGKMKPEAAEEIDEFYHEIKRVRELSGVHYPSDRKISEYLFKQLVKNKLIK